MRVLVAKLGIAVFLAFIASRGSAGELLDRIVATVENVPILQSDWEQAVGFEALEQGRTVSSFTDEERHAVLERLVDQQLIRLQIGDESIAAAEEREIAKQLEKIRASYPQAKSDADWHQLLAQYQIDEDLLQKKVAQQLQVMRFVDLRLRPEARVDRAAVEAYYSDTLLPEVRKRGGKEESLATVYPQIEEILKQQRIDTLLNAWLQDLRDHSDIRWLEGSGKGTASAANAGGH